MSRPVKLRKEDLLALVPALRAMANLLVDNFARADDLVEETLLEAWADTGLFVQGTTLRICLFTILRKQFYSRYPGCKTGIEDARSPKIAELPQTFDAAGLTEFAQFRHAMQELPSEHREALILIDASRLSCEEAARVCGCAIGTIISRVDCARVRLVEFLGSDLAEASPLNRQSGEPSASNRSQPSRTQS
jgi:RNA polymerase sigma-70 factor (ECF subfamily)